MELSLLAKLPNNQQKLITEGQPVILEIVVTEAKAQESLSPPDGTKLNLSCLAAQFLKRFEVWCMAKMKMASDSSQTEYRLAVKITQTAKTGMAGIADDYVVEDFDLEAGSPDEVTGDFDVRFRWSGFHLARMVVRDDDRGNNAP